MQTFRKTLPSYHGALFVLSILSGLFLFPNPGRTADSKIHIERVIGPEFPGKYKHPAAIEQLSNGDLYLVYYSGAGEYASDTAVFGSRYSQEEGKWSMPKIIADTPYRSEGNAVIWQAPDGVVWLFYVCRYGDTWSTSRIKAKISQDGAQTWSDPMLLTFREGMMVRNRPIVLSNGEYLLPVYHETGHDTEGVGPDSVSLFLRYDPTSHRWKPTGEIRSAKGNIQPAVVQLSPRHLLAYCRRGGDYEPTKDGWIIRSESFDGGKTWTKGKKSQFANPNAAIDFLKLRSGNLLLIYNNSMNDRTPLSATISTDNDKSYTAKKNLVEGPGPYAYPYAIEAKDGQIHLVYTTENRTVIMHAHFSENAILQQ